MNLQQERIQTACAQLALTTVAEQYSSLAQQAARQELSYGDFLEALLKAELAARQARTQYMLTRTAGFPTLKTLADYDFEFATGAPRAQLLELASLAFIERAENVILLGPSGVGKTWLACALGNQACRQGLTVRYTRLPRLVEQLRIAHGDGTYPRLMTQLAKIELLILDDWGMQKLQPTQRQDLMEVIEDRYANRATLIASQLPVDQWHSYLGDATLADAILDRLLHNAHRLELTGESLRKQAIPLDAS